MRLIDADALMERVNRKKSEAAKVRYTEGFNDAILRVRSMIHSAPTIEADVQEVKHGEWVSHGKGYGLVYQCSECGWIDSHPFNKRFCFCPNCGARMDGDKK